MKRKGDQTPRTRRMKPALRRIAGRLKGQPRQSDPDAPRILRVPRRAALILIAILIGVASAASFAESYRGLYEWARQHGLASFWAAVWPVQVDVFIAVGELALFVALIDGWRKRDRAGAWAATILGLAVSVAGNVGHIASHAAPDRATAAVPPLAAASALAVGLGVLKRVVAARRAGAAEIQAEPAEGPEVEVPEADIDALDAGRRALTASIVAGNPLSQRQVMTRFRITRAEERELRQMVTTPDVAGTDVPPAVPATLNGSASA